MKTVKTNDLKKGTRIVLTPDALSFTARLEDNKKGNVRLATVYGIETEMGSIYAHNIERAHVDGAWCMVEHTISQLKCKEL